MPEALITINGTTLTDEQSRTVTAALAAYGLMLQDPAFRKTFSFTAMNRQLCLDQILSLIEETV